MELLIVLVAVAVLGIAAIVAAGRFGEMPEDPVRDSPAPLLPERTLHSEDLEGIQFGVAVRGYEMAEVDQMIARLAKELDDRDAARDDNRTLEEGKDPVAEGARDIATDDARSAGPAQPSEANAALGTHAE